MARLMARTQAPDYDQRREAILDRAAALFARTGFLGTSVADLAAACETSKSLIYHYYPSKEDVLYAVMASHVDQLVAEVGAVMAAGGEPRAMLGTLIDRFMRDYVGAADRQKVLLNELGNLPPDRRALIVRQQRVILDAVQSLLGQVHAALAADPVRARVHTMLLFGMINWTHTWFDPAGPVSAAEVATLVTRHALSPLP